MITATSTITQAYCIYVSTATGSKISNLCPNFISFFEIANLCTHDTDPVPLCCQENGINDIQFFGLLSDAEHDFTFQIYNSNGDSSGIHVPIMMGIMTQVKTAIQYCKFCFANTNDRDAMKPQHQTESKYSDFYMHYHLRAINDTTIINDIGKHHFKSAFDSKFYPCIQEYGQTFDPDKG